MVAIVLSSLVVVLYTYVGYPALVLLWAKLFPRPSWGLDDYEPTVSVCLAVHDGAPYLHAKIRSIQNLDYPKARMQILVFSDGSTDGTEALVRELAASDPRIRLLSSEERRGKPTALNRLRAAARGEVLLLSDVRQPLARGTLRAIVRGLSDRSVGCVSGKLALSGEGGSSAYARYEHFIRSAESRAGSMVGVAGSIYGIRRADMPTLPADVLLDDMFVPLSVALEQKKRIALAPGAVAHDAACDDTREFFRKVRTLAGNYQLVWMMPRLLVPVVNPVWFQFVCHKLLRLACPWALAALFGASAQLAFGAGRSPGFRLLIAAQIAFYLAALLGFALGRAGAVARTFVVMNAAAVVGLWRFLRRTQSVIW